MLGRTGRPYVRLYQNETNLRCTMMIDATGSAGWLRRRLGLRRVALSDPMFALRGQVRGVIQALAIFQR